MIRIDISHDDLTPGLNALSGLLADMTPVMQEIGRFLVVTTKDRFQEGTAPDGTPWAAKSPATIAAYARRKVTLDPRPLFGPSGDLHRQIFAEATSHSVEVGSNMIYAAVMQFGAAQGAFGANKAGRPIPWGAIPARPFLGLSESDRAGIGDIVSEWLDRVAQGQP